MKNNFIIDEYLTIHPADDSFEHFTQNSVGTKFFAVKLDGWALAEGEHLFIAFEKKGEEPYSIDPILMGKARDENIYFSVMPSEVMLQCGTWEASIYKKLNFNEETGKADAVEVGEPFSFPVTRTIRDGSGNAVTQYDLANLAQFQHDLESGVYAARGLYPWKEGFTYRVGEIVFYAKIAGQEHGAFVRSINDNNSAEPYDGEGNFNAEHWEEVINFNNIREDFWNALKDLADTADKRASAAEDARNEAVQARDDARSAAGEIAELKNRMVHWVQELPALEDAVDGEAYAVLADRDGNVFELWLPQNGEWVFLGSECFLANGMKQYEFTLSANSWAEKRQSLVIPDFTDGWIVDSVIPAEESAIKYLLQGVRFQSAEGGLLTFSCDTVPEEDIAVIVAVKAEYLLPSLSQYYTRPQTERLVEEKIGEVVAGAPSAFDTLKEIAEYIEKDKAGAAVLIERVTENEENISAETKARTAADQKLADEKQDAETDALNTEAKTIVGAINEQNDFLDRVKEEVSTTHSFLLTIHPEDWHNKELSLYANTHPKLAKVTLDSFVKCIPSAACSVTALKNGIRISSYTNGSITLSCNETPESDYEATIIIENNL